MPKRKRSNKYEEDLDHLRQKIRKLQRKIQSRSESVTSHSGFLQDDFVLQDPASPLLRPDDWFPDYSDEDLAYDDSFTPDVNQHSPIEEQQNCTENPHNPSEDEHNPVEEQNNSDVDQELPVLSQGLSSSNANLQTDIPSTSATKPLDDSQLPVDDTVNLDEDVLLILGDDPSSSLKHGKEIRKEIATRFTHIATEGTTKEIRKDLIAKYPIPANCLHIDAPKLNAEIKAAISENFAKRDKGIETKQKEMASALACLGDIITSQLNAKDKNNDFLQKLMDLSRILCDIQHADSVTRRNFILFNLKKDLKDHLVNTKIDTFLFGENLSETLKTAKAVNKSGIEIKAAAPNQAPPARLRSAVHRPLNRRGPAPRRPPPGPPPPPAPRGRAPAPRGPPPPPPPPHTRYYRTSYAHQPPQRRY